MTLKTIPVLIMKKFFSIRNLRQHCILHGQNHQKPQSFSRLNKDSTRNNAEEGTKGSS
jgi:hypothetical protein